MGLTSGAFQVLMICAAVAGLAGVVRVWPRAAGRRGRHLAGRLGLLLGSQILVIATFLICLNGYFGFISTWSELLGTGRPPAAGSGAAAAAARALANREPSFLVTRTQPGPDPRGALVTASAPGARASRGKPGSRGPGREEPGDSARPGSGPGGTSAGRHQAGPGPGVTGRLLQVSMTGPRTGLTVHDDYVYLPPQYFQRAYAKARFPVVLALTGYPGSAWTLVSRLGLPAEAARLAAAGRLPPAVHVLMGSPALPRDTECTDIPAGPQVETFFAQDVPRLIEQHFRVQSGASGWSALGYSTGGYCAAKLAMLNPYQFRWAVSVAGY